MARTEIQLAVASSKKDYSWPAALTFCIAPGEAHVPGFEKLPVVAFTFGAFAANFVQERGIQNCFPVDLSQAWYHNFQL